MIINKSNCIYEANKNLHSTREAFLFLVHYFKIQMNWISIKVFHCITNIKCRHRFLLSYNITIKILLLFSAGSSFFWQFDKRITSLESCRSRNNKKKYFPRGIVCQPVWKRKAIYFMYLGTDLAVCSSKDLISNVSISKHDISMGF